MSKKKFAQKPMEKLPNLEGKTPPVTAATALSRLSEGSDATKLERCETLIRQGIKAFFEMGQALKQIRDEGLYKEHYSTFEEYCQQRWNFERRHAYRLIDSAEVVANVSAATQTLPVSESQARPLTKLEPEQQKKAWQLVVEEASQSGKPITARLVTEMAKQIARPQAHQEEHSTRESPPSLPPETPVQISGQWLQDHQEVERFCQITETNPRHVDAESTHVISLRQVRKLGWLR